MNAGAFFRDMLRFQGGSVSCGRPPLRADGASGLAKMPLAAMWAQRDVDAGAAQDTLGERFVRLRLRGGYVQRRPDGGQGLLALCGREPAVVADLLKAGRQSQSVPRSGSVQQVILLFPEIMRKRVKP